METSTIKTEQAAVAPVVLSPTALYRWQQVKQFIPVGRSTWMAGVKSGRYPAPVRIGPNTTCWRGADLLAIINGVGRSEALPV